MVLHVNGLSLWHKTLVGGFMFLSLRSVTGRHVVICLKVAEVVRDKDSVSTDTLGIVVPHNCSHLFLPNFLSDFNFWI